MAEMNCRAMRCLIVSTQTREQLLASGLTEGSVNEIEDFRAYLIAKKRGHVQTHKQWKSRSPKWRREQAARP
jgi:hypothetical protein